MEALIRFSFVVGIIAITLTADVSNLDGLGQQVTADHYGDGRQLWRPTVSELLDWKVNTDTWQRGQISKAFVPSYAA